ncbi:unnamed protein product [Paramecium sonneborni]|uniref:Uncharacterized protein n=1 Tax=Paramecium sonneborni TaxID=65129 RepID=A0A8S1NEZ7_9CILI|nr:unnamed protein product [Paramecium sonneborni]
MCTQLILNKPTLQIKIKTLLFYKLKCQKDQQKYSVQKKIYDFKLIKRLNR